MSPLLVFCLVPDILLLFMVLSLLSMMSEVDILVSLCCLPSILVLLGFDFSGVDSLANALKESVTVKPSKRNRKSL